MRRRRILLYFKRKTCIHSSHYKPPASPSFLLVTFISYVTTNDDSFISVLHQRYISTALSCHIVQSTNTLHPQWDQPHQVEIDSSYSNSKLVSRCLTPTESFRRRGRQKKVIFLNIFYLKIYNFFFLSFFQHVHTTVICFKCTHWGEPNCIFSSEVFFILTGRSWENSWPEFVCIKMSLKKPIFIYNTFTFLLVVDGFIMVLFPGSNGLKTKSIICLNQM